MDKTNLFCPRCGRENLYQTSTVVHRELICPACGYVNKDYEKPHVHGAYDWEGFLRKLGKRGRR